MANATKQETTATFDESTVQLISDNLTKQGLTTVIKNMQDPENSLDTDYFLRLTNCIYLISQKSQESYTVGALQRRRAAF